MKDGDKLLQLVNRRNALRYLWVVFTLPILTYDYFEWRGYSKQNKN